MPLYMVYSAGRTSILVCVIPASFFGARCNQGSFKKGEVLVKETTFSHFLAKSGVRSETIDLGSTGWS